VTAQRFPSPAATWLPILMAAGLAAPLRSFAGHSAASATATTSSSHEETSKAEAGWEASGRPAGLRRSGASEVDAYLFRRGHGSRLGSGVGRDWKEAEEALRGENVPGLWLRRGDQRYVITDRDWLDRVEKVFAPQLEVGRKQGDLGRRQGELGRLRGELGRKQARLGRMQAELARRQAIAVRAEAAWLDSRRSSEAAAAAEREREEIEREREALGDLMTELGALQSRLGERQSALGERRSALGAEQARISKRVARELDELVREALREGVAKRLR